MDDWEKISCICCKHFKQFIYCKVLDHIIINSYAMKYHSENCNSFEKIDEYKKPLKRIGIDTMLSEEYLYTEDK